MGNHASTSSQQTQQVNLVSAYSPYLHLESNSLHNCQQPLGTAQQDFQSGNERIPCPRRTWERSIYEDTAMVREPGLTAINRPGLTNPHLSLSVAGTMSHVWSRSSLRKTRSKSLRNISLPSKVRANPLQHPSHSFAYDYTEPHRRYHSNQHELQ